MYDVMAGGGGYGAGKTKARAVAVETSWTTKLLDSTATGGYTLGSVSAAGAQRQRTTHMAVETRDYVPRWWKEG